MSSGFPYFLQFKSEFWKLRAQELLKQITIIFITSNDSLASGQITEGTQPCPSTELKILLTFNLKFKIQFKILVD